MHLTNPISSILLLSATASATSTTLFKNYCVESLFVSLNGAKPPVEIPSGQAFATNIAGKGNTAVVTKNIDTFNSATAKAVLGSSSDGGVLYWSISAQDGDPFAPSEHFNVTTGGTDATGVVIPNLCGNATTYDGLVHACQDSGSVVLAFEGCPFNAAV